MVAAPRMRLGKASGHSGMSRLEVTMVLLALVAFGDHLVEVLILGCL